LPACAQDLVIELDGVSGQRDQKRLGIRATLFQNSRCFGVSSRFALSRIIFNRRRNLWLSCLSVDAKLRIDAIKRQQVKARQEENRESFHPEPP